MLRQARLLLIKQEVFVLDIIRSYVGEENLTPVGVFLLFCGWFRSVTKFFACRPLLVTFSARFLTAAVNDFVFLDVDLEYEIAGQAIDASVSCRYFIGE